MPSARNVEAPYELPEGYEEEMSEAFEIFDANGDGFIDFKQTKNLIKSLGFRINPQEIRNLFMEADESNSGLIDYQHFRDATAKELHMKEFTEASSELHRAFTLFDKDRTDAITFENIQEAALRVGETLSDEEIREMIRDAAGQESSVSLEAFTRYMSQTPLW